MAFEALHRAEAQLTWAADIVDTDDKIFDPMTGWLELMESQIKRRLAPTGCPLQNKLTECYTMVHWVRQDLLDNKQSLKERFVAPITKGQAHQSQCQAGIYFLGAR